MGMTTEQVLGLASFMERVMEVAVDSGIRIDAGQKIQISVSDGHGSENVAVIKTAELIDTTEEYTWWLELDRVF